MSIQTGEFHEANGWFFTRLPSGTVRIRVERGNGQDVVHLIPASSWDSIVQWLSVETPSDK